MRPKWTVLYNIVSPESQEWIGTGWEFFTNEEDADRAYTRHLKLGNVPTRRPFYPLGDNRHLGATQRQPSQGLPGHR